MSKNSLVENISHHVCSRNIDGKVYMWKIETLWEYARDFSPKTMQTSDFNLDIDCWFLDRNVPTVNNILAHIRRIFEANLDFPIILDPEGLILDGYHRIAKAILEDITSINTVRLPQYPPPDYVYGVPLTTMSYETTL